VLTTKIGYRLSTTANTCRGPLHRICSTLGKQDLSVLVPAVAVGWHRLTERHARQPLTLAVTCDVEQQLIETCRCWCLCLL
jgi:hypothetical protein